MWDRLTATTGEISRGLSSVARSKSVQVSMSCVGSMFGFFFAEVPVHDWESARKSDTARFAEFFRVMLGEGIYLAPSQFEAGFVSTAHGPAEVAATLSAAEKAFTAVSKRNNDGPGK